MAPLLSHGLDDVLQNVTVGLMKGEKQNSIDAGDKQERRTWPWGACGPARLNAPGLAQARPMQTSPLLWHLGRKNMKHGNGRHRVDELFLSTAINAMN